MSKAEPAREEDTPSARTEEDPGRVDAWIREGRYEEALALGQTLLAAVAPGARGALEYRLALCQEGLGRSELARGAFRALAGGNPRAAAGDAAELGQARIALKSGKPEEARELLGPLLLRSGDPVLRDQPWLADLPYLLALATSLETGPRGKPDPLVPQALARPTGYLPLERYLDGVACKEEAPPKEAEPAGARLDVQTKGAGSEEWTVSASTRHEPVFEFVNRLADKARLRCQWAPQARQQVAGHTLTVVVEGMPLTVLLRGVGAAAGLSWVLEKDGLSLATESEAGEPRRRDRAREALRAALVAHPDHPLAAAAYLEMGNQEVYAGRLPEGIAWYERLVREMPRARLATEAYYNLGSVQQLLGQVAAARNSYFWVVDRGPGQELAVLAYLKIGRTHLDENQPAAALRPLRRALAGAGPGARAPAALAVAAADLLTDNPRAAHATLWEAREAIGQEPYKAVAALLDALARYRARPDPKQADRAAADLLTALVGYREEPILGPVGVFLAGRAYRDLGLGDRTADLFEKTLRNVHGPLAAEMTADLAEHLYQAGRRSDARRRFESLAALPERGPVTRLAELRLAEIALKDGRAADCLKGCRKALKEDPDCDRVALLRLMGQAFALQGDHARAARCFAGQIPD